MEKRLKPRPQYWAGTWPGATVRSVVACHVRSVDQSAGPRPSGPVQLRRRPACPRGCAHTGRASGVVTTRNLRMVARSPTAQWWLAGGKVLPTSPVRTTGRVPGNESGGGAHRGRRSTARRGGISVQRHAVESSPKGGSAVTPTSS
jgi:hypothetical protein